jgi:hypothetical protein
MVSLLCFGRLRVIITAISGKYGLLLVYFHDGSKVSQEATIDCNTYFFASSGIADKLAQPTKRSALAPY